MSVGPRIRFCPTGKIAYVRKENAKVRIRLLRKLPRRAFPKGRPPQTYYKCPHCDFYHLTSSIGTLENGNRKPI